MARNTLKLSMISEKLIDVRPIITDVYPMKDIHSALDAATDRSQSVKVQVGFED